MNFQPTSNTDAAAPSPHPIDIYGDFLNWIGRTVKCISLYGASHPQTADYLKEALYQFGQIIARTKRDRMVLTLSGERLLVNGVRATETVQAREVMRAMFATHGLTSLVILAAVKPSELSLLCELAAASGDAPGASDFHALLSKGGVTHILCVNESALAENTQKPFVLDAPLPTVNAQKPLLRQPPPAPAAPVMRAPAPRPEPAPKAPKATQPSAPVQKTPHASFGSLLKNLVESAATDPEERLQLYQEAAGLVKEALNQRIEEATKELQQEKHRLTGEQARTEQVLSTVADGVVIVDKAGKVLMMNTAAEQISGKRLIDMVGKHISESVDPEIQMVTMSEDLELPAEGEDAKMIRVIAKEEVERTLRRSFALVQNDAGRLVGTYSMLPEAAKLKETTRMQEEFLSRITHDLKAPLSSLSCGLEMIVARMGPRMAPEETGFVDICMRNAHQLARMINEILDFSKLESGQMTVRTAATPTATILKETIESLGPWAKTRGLSLLAEPAPAGLTVLADPIRVVQVLSNLVSNAIKSTPEAGRISLEVSVGTNENRGFAVFSVKDTGCGIPKESLSHIFDKFFQVDGAVGRREGVGLGLTIVSEMVALHRGRVWVESEVGQGSSFFFTIPLAPTPETDEKLPW